MMKFESSKPCIFEISMVISVRIHLRTIVLAQLKDAGGLTSVLIKIADNPECSVMTTWDYVGLYSTRLHVHPLESTKTVIIYSCSRVLKP